MGAWVVRRSGIRRRFAVLTLALIGLADLSWSPIVSAIEPEVAEAPLLPPLPEGVPPLPSPRDRSGGLIITSRNEASFEDLLLAPVAVWLKEDRFVMRVVRNIDFSWKLAADWEEGSRKNSLLADLDPTGSLIWKEEPAASAPFGDAERVNAEPDPERRAKKILWNIQYRLGAEKDTLYDIELVWMGAQSALRRASGLSFRRVFHNLAEQQNALPKSKPVAAAAGAEKGATPEKVAAAQVATLEPPTALGQPGDLFVQELFHLYAPPVVYGYSQIGWRYRGPEEDRYWMHSPILGATRELLQSNRSDSILGSGLSLDDLSVWSTKPQSVHAKVVAEKVLLLPFSALNYYRMEMQPAAGLPSAKLGQPSAEAAPKPESVLTARGFHQRSDGTLSMVLWNADTKQFAQFPPWVPTTVFFVPRKVWILELAPKDPYYSVGREILIVDQESQLPFYKLVYDRFGEYRKTILGGWGLAQARDGRVRFPFSTFIMAVDRDSQSTTVLTTLQARTFLGKESRLANELRALFDPANHKRVAAAPPKEAKESEDEAAAESSESDGETESEEAGSEEAETVEPDSAESIPAID